MSGDPFERFERSQSGLLIPVLIFIVGAILTTLALRSLDDLVSLKSLADEPPAIIEPAAIEPAAIERAAIEPDAIEPDDTEPAIENKPNRAAEPAIKSEVDNENQEPPRQ
jgi:hypothetical protein